MRMRYLCAVAALSMGLLGPGTKAQANGVPVFDSSTFAQVVAYITQHAEQMDIDLSQLENLISQLETLQSQYEAITGARDAVAGLLDGDPSKLKIAQTLRALNDLDGVAGEIGERAGEIDALYEILSGEQLYGDPDDSSRETVYDAQSDAIRSAMIVSEESFSDAAEGFDRYDTYRDALSGETPDLKASIDLNTRVQIENGEMLVRILQAISANGFLSATESAQRQRAGARNRQMLSVSSEE